jgi:hypothetical protein
MPVYTKTGKCIKCGREISIGELAWMFTPVEIGGCGWREGTQVVRFMGGSHEVTKRIVICYSCGNKTKDEWEGGE